MIRISKITLFLLLIPAMILAQFNVSGELTPNAMIRISDGSLINLPYRAGFIHIDYAMGDFDLKTQTALESRWEGLEFSEDLVQLREAYLIWYPSFGEVKAGKMIHAWGAADGNNPTDNLSPYDFLYMFGTGTDKKIGTLSLSSLIYAGDFQIELVVLPEFVENHLPLDEPDFPLNMPLPENAITTYPENAVEMAAKVQYASSFGDLSVSLFEAYDHMPSSAGIGLDVDPMTGQMDMIPQLSFRKTRMIGMDGVFFPGNWTIRAELGYFQTETPDLDLDASLLVTEASYTQSVFQLEYAFSNGLNLMGQYISTQYGDISNTFTPDATFLSLPPSAQQDFQAQLSGAEFQPGMGTPFAMIAENVVMFSSMLETLDNTLEVGAMLMMNMDETGYMSRLQASYAIWESMSLDAGISTFIGGDEEGNRFRELEDFSHLSLGIGYNF